MNSFRKFTAALATLALMMTSVLTFGVAVAATTFTDASGIASWAADSVSSLADTGVLSGRPDGSFDPQGQLNRAEMAKVAMLAAGLTEDTTGAPHFNDVAASDWYYSFVETLYNNGVVGGINAGALDSNGLATYDPAGTLNRAEGSKILVDAFELETSYSGTPPNFPDVASSAWFYDYVETAYAHGILNGYDNGNFGPGDAITREQVAVIAQNSIDESTDASKRRSDYTAGAASAIEPTTPTPVVPTSEGDLSVAISASSPAAQTFPRGASSTPVAAFDFTATSDDIVISNLVIKRTGVGTDSDWTLYIYDGSDRLTSGKTVNSTTHEATFTGVSVTVAAGTSKTLTLKADTSSTTTSGGDSYFEITSADKVTTNAQSVGGTFPIKSTKQEINTSVDAGTITITKQGSITNPKVGEDNITIAKFKLETANEAGLVNEIALLVDGTISASDVQNAKLFQGTTELATTASVNAKDLLVFTLDTPFEISKGDSRNFEVKADLNTARGADTIKIYLDEGTDLVSTGGTYGFGMAVTYTGAGGYDGTTGKLSECTVQGGEITISSSGPTAADIAVNGDDIVMMDFNITTLSEITVKKFSVYFYTNDADGSDQGGLVGGTAGTTANYTDIKIVNKDTGAVVLGPIDSDVLTQTAEGTVIGAGTDGDGYYVFTDEFTMAAGESLDLQLILDIANNTAADFVDDTIYALIDIVDGSYPLVKDINNKTVDVGDNVVPTSDITGKTMTVTSPSLTVTKSSTPVSDTAVKGTNDVDLIGLTMAAGDASDITISEMLIRVRANAANGSFNTGNVAAADTVNNIELWVGDTKIAGPEGLSAPGTIGTGYYTATFDNMSYTVGQGETIQIVVKGDLSSSATAILIGADIDPDNDITCEDNDGNSVTAAGTAALNAGITQDPVLTVSTGGSLTVAVDADTTKENIVVAGTSDVEISKFKFTTTDEAFLVKKISINNRQSAVTTAANTGDYDNNVISVKLSYTNSGGETETKTGYLTSGTANFSGMDMLIAKDDDAVLTITATLNTIAAGAKEAEFVDLNIAFNDFEAVAQGSGETYKGDKIDSDTAAASDLDFGSITWTDTGATSTTTTVSAAGSAQTLTLNAAKYLPVGTLLLIDEATNNGTYTAGADPIFVATSVIDSISAVTTVLDNGATVTTGKKVYYALPGTGYLTASNQMVVYETKPTITLSASSPSGSRTTAASDSAFIFTIAADAQEKVQFRQETNTLRDSCNSAGTEVDTGGTVSSVTTSSTVLAEGTASNVATFSATNSADAGIYFSATAGTIDDAIYPKVSFWVNIDPVAFGSTAVTEAQIEFVCGATNVTDFGTAAGAGSSDIVTADAGGWVYYTVTNPCAAVATDDDQYGVVILAAATLANGDKMYIDGIRFHKTTDANDRLVVDVSSDGSLETTASNVRVLLKEGGSTVAEGGFNMTSASAATISFFPYGTYTDIDISKGTSKTFTVQLDTTSVVSDSAGTDDPVTFSIALGSSTGGSVTAGGVYWYDTNAQVEWLGQVIDDPLNGNTLKY